MVADLCMRSGLQGGLLWWVRRARSPCSALLLLGRNVVGALLVLIRPVAEGRPVLTRARICPNISREGWPRRPSSLRFCCTYRLGFIWGLGYWLL